MQDALVALHARELERGRVARRRGDPLGALERPGAGPAAAQAELDEHLQRPHAVPASASRHARDGLDRVDEAVEVEAGVGGELGGDPAQRAPARRARWRAAIRSIAEARGRPAPGDVAAVIPQAPAASWRSKSSGAIVVLPCGASETPRSLAPAGHQLDVVLERARLAARAPGVGRSPASRFHPCSRTVAGVTPSGPGGKPL